MPNAGLTDLKWAGQILVAIGAAGLPFSHLFYVVDSVRGTRFLVDTGSEVGVIPRSLFSVIRVPPTS